MPEGNDAEKIGPVVRWAQVIVALALCVAWAQIGARLRFEPGIFIAKSLVVGAALSIPAWVSALRGYATPGAAGAAILGALVVLVGQWLLYTLLSDLETGEPIGAAEGIREVVWDLTFQGAPETLYVGMALVAGTAAGLTIPAGRAVRRRRFSESARP